VEKKNSSKMKTTHSKRGTDRQLVSLHDVRCKRDDRDKNRCACPNEVEKHRVNASCEGKSLEINEGGLLGYTFNHPVHLSLSRIQCLPDPSFFPSKKFDEFNLYAISEKIALATGGYLQH